jgi:UDP-N-acetylmuramate dehydrogenase
MTFKRNVLLAPYTTLKIGGPAEFFYEAATVDELVAAVKKAREERIPVTVLGGGTNILIGDKGIGGLVIRNTTRAITMRGMKASVQKGRKTGMVYVEADSGVLFNTLVRFTVDEGLGGLEVHLGLPGTVGGAIYMNSKWTNPVTYVGDALYQATILTPENEVMIVDRSYFRFAYDTSIIQKTRDIVLRVVFALIPGQKDKLWKTANQCIAYRRERQPQGVKSPGCTFRNLSQADAISLSSPNRSTSAGFILDHAGLKGVTVGGAQISPIHANFIVNTGNASARDVEALIDLAVGKVKAHYGITLKEEIVRLGEF